MLHRGHGRDDFFLSVKYIDSKGNSHVLESERIDIFIHNDKNDGNIILELKAIMKPIGEMEKVQVRKYFPSYVLHDCNMFDVLHLN